MKAGVSLKVESISKSFCRKGCDDLRVLTDISFTANAGEVIAVLGRSGTGKTTLLDIIASLETPSSGSVMYDGRISYVPQKDLLLPWLDLERNVTFPFEIGGTLDDSLKERMSTFLQEVGLDSFRKSYPEELSGGMCQKASLVRLFVQDAPLCLFDEPLSAIDFDSRQRLLRKIRSFIVEGNKVGIFVTHNIEEAISVADRLLVFGEKPAKVVYETRINIPDNERHPVSIRKHMKFQSLFETVWKVMAKS